MIDTHVAAHVDIARTPPSALRVALVADPLFVYSGAERVIQQILEIYPQSDVFALVDFLDEDARRFLGGRPVRTSFIQRLPLARRHFRKILNLWPTAVEQLDLRGYDLVISSHNAVAHGVITSPSQTHVAYTHSPMRYAWDLQEEYLADARMSTGPKGIWARRALHDLRQWDFAAAQRPDAFAANSSFVAGRIKKYYRRSSTVINPPVSIETFSLAKAKGDYYVTAGRLVSYKRVDLIIEAFERLGRRLIVVGDGPEASRLRALSGRHVEFAGKVDHATLNRLLGEARAFVFAGIEDFGIAPVEAQAAGTPVIALDAGGLRETVRGHDQDDATGLFFAEQTIESLITAVERFERERSGFDPHACRKHAMTFGAERFRLAFRDLVDQTIPAIT